MFALARHRIIEAGNLDGYTSGIHVMESRNADSI